MVVNNGRIDSIDELYNVYMRGLYIAHGEANTKLANLVLQYILDYGTFYELEYIGAVLSTL